MHQVSISIKISVRRLDGDSQEVTKADYWCKISAAKSKTLELLSNLRKQTTVWYKKLTKQETTKRRHYEHNIFCECQHKCKQSPRTYWSNLKKELVWTKQGHLRVVKIGN